MTNHLRSQRHISQVDLGTPIVEISACDLYTACEFLGSVIERYPAGLPVIIAGAFAFDRYTDIRILKIGEYLFEILGVYTKGLAANLDRSVKIGLFPAFELFAERH